MKHLYPTSLSLIFPSLSLILSSTLLLLSCSSSAPTEPNESLALRPGSFQYRFSNTYYDSVTGHRTVVEQDLTWGRDRVEHHGVESVLTEVEGDRVTGPLYIDANFMALTENGDIVQSRYPSRKLGIDVPGRQMLWLRIPITTRKVIDRTIYDTVVSALNSPVHCTARYRVEYGADSTFQLNGVEKSVSRFTGELVEEQVWAISSSDSVLNSVTTQFTCYYLAEAGYFALIEERVLLSSNVDVKRWELTDYRLYDPD